MRKVLILLAACIGLTAHAQSDLQSSINYGFDAVLVNPALLQDHVYSFMTGGYIQGYAGDYSPNDVGSREGAKFKLSSSRIEERVRSATPIFYDRDIETLGYNLRSKKGQFGFHHAMRFRGNVEAPADFIRLIGEGNARLEGEQLSVLPKGEYFSYHELGIHYGTQVNDKLALGLRLKILAGNGAVQINEGRADLLTAPDTYIVDYDVDVSVNTAGVDFDLNTENYSIDFDQWNPTAGFGGAIDLGLVARPNSKTEFALSINDFGAIRWGSSARQHVAKGAGTYQGVTGRIFDENFSFRLDTVIQGLKDEAGLATRNEVFTTQLSPKLNTHLRYRLSDATDLTLSASAYNRLGWSGTAALGIAQNFDDFLHLGVIAGLSEGELMFGGRASLMLLGVRLNASVDNFGVITNAYEQRHLQARLGASINLRRIAKDGRRFGWFDDEPRTGRRTPDNYL